MGTSLAAPTPRLPVTTKPDVCIIPLQKECSRWPRLWWSALGLSAHEGRKTYAVADAIRCWEREAEAESDVVEAIFEFTTLNLSVATPDFLGVKFCLHLGSQRDGVLQRIVRISRGILELDGV